MTDDVIVSIEGALNSQESRLHDLSPASLTCSQWVSDFIITINGVLFAKIII